MVEFRDDDDGVLHAANSTTAPDLKGFFVLTNVICPALCMLLRDQSGKSENVVLWPVRPGMGAQPDDKYEQDREDVEGAVEVAACVSGPEEERGGSRALVAFRGVAQTGCLGPQPE